MLRACLISHLTSSTQGAHFQVLLLAPVPNAHIVPTTVTAVSLLPPTILSFPTDTPPSANGKPQSNSVSPPTPSTGSSAASAISMSNSLLPTPLSPET
ncbi:hypothetical protein AUEXF2481DRAFT_42334 [Aureobasidium subglaciale EXF-2481]|uniref:Uncharacterized protein n=1 Tax=Aureobasidium subglaciale (strain EXF-2481) TaxID=1043005 RepID=A0A074Z263_AURSE|nr:uncharacterized protein AUEXF2481DRAFT_42334 [Aureobasidium subglaciale EXF-2481]KEQ93111.1 hypothetical protein AUEXF2481DRAFT_42334 [Aureobasidium subglaciale EXF-2481]